MGRCCPGRKGGGAPGDRRRHNMQVAGAGAPRSGTGGLGAGAGAARPALVAAARYGCGRRGCGALRRHCRRGPERHEGPRIRGGGRCARVEFDGARRSHRQRLRARGACVRRGPRRPQGRAREAVEQPLVRRRLCAEGGSHRADVGGLGRGCALRAEAEAEPHGARGRRSGLRGRASVLPRSRRRGLRRERRRVRSLRPGTGAEAGRGMARGCEDAGRREPIAQRHRERVRRRDARSLVGQGRGLAGERDAAPRCAGTGAGADRIPHRPRLGGERHRLGLVGAHHGGGGWDPRDAAGGSEGEGAGEHRRRAERGLRRGVGDHPGRCEHRNGRGQGQACGPSGGDHRRRPGRGGGEVRQAAYCGAGGPRGLEGCLPEGLGVLRAPRGPRAETRTQQDADGPCRPHL
mmetsp:Transcript_41423/g.119263  ORF Transcript_41423/g.119263 Transcript_41423/m.119263 type:complete len:405 (+) Transcript_41423:766-1980(+)